MSLSILLDMAVEGFAERLILGRRGTGYTVAELNARSIGGAAVIRDAGADALIYLDVNGPCFPTALFASARAGVPLVPINYRLGADQLATLIANHPGAIAIADGGTKSLFAESGVTCYTSEEWLAISAVGADAGVQAVDSDDTDAPAAIIYTSGTTSTPKGVLLSAQNLVSYVVGSVEFAGATADETALVSVPPYHIAALANAITNLYVGRRCIVLEQFSGEDWLTLVRAEQVTHALVVPTMLARIMAARGDLSVPSLRSLAYGGATMPIKVIERALAAWPHVDFVNAYGLTETSSTISVLGPEEHRAALRTEDPAVRARLGSAGRPVPTIELEIRGDTGAVVAAGTVGRIWVRGEQVSARYSGTGSALAADGFFDTRDEGYLDADGYLFVNGRADDTIIRGGENIAPAEIEDAILAHDDVDDAVVVGIDDPEWGQHLEAAVVARPGAHVEPEQLRDFVRARLRGSKTPDRVWVWDELPRTETGKIIRRRVVERIASHRAMVDPAQR